jgi:4-alpha-glucanotransferase
MSETQQLRELARLYHLQSVYTDGFGRRREAPVEAVLRTLRDLGAPVESLKDLSDARRQTLQALCRRALDPVIVGWQDRPLNLKLRLPERLAEAPVKISFGLESGESVEGECLEPAPTIGALREACDGRYVIRRLRLLTDLPLGYHRIHLQVADVKADARLFHAPPHAYAASSGGRWGVFCPLYALRSARSWGAGDFSDLTALVEFAGERGAHAVGTLPMLASFLGEPFNPSPYAPVSRLFWSEFYLDLTRVAELEDCRPAREMLASDAFRRELEDVRTAALVDYRAVMVLKRKILEELLRSFLRKNSLRRERFEKFAATHPRLQDYAAFRAKMERERKSWLHWEAARRGGLLTANDYDEGRKRYHLYAQWLCAEQAASACRAAKDHGVELYADFPLGVNRDGYDVWRERDLFVLNASGGAPPDGLFVKGQNWGFPPFHPEALRRQGYRYYIDCLRHHMAAGGMLRIDHVMGLHRAFWVPDGFAATEGLYVHGCAPEFYAILNLESHRHQTQIIGENLGTVPPYVNRAMERHKILGMHVGIFSVGGDPQSALEPVPANVVASLGTHDTATFAGFWRGGDIQDRLSLGLRDERQADEEQSFRAKQREALVAFLRSRGWLNDETSELAVLRGWLTHLAQQPAQFLLINLEDLWLEALPQNVPGTWQERPNWRRKARLSLEDIRADDGIAEILTIVRDLRGRMR